jgi:PGF-pre-PGF domain-containing protein
MKGIYDYKLNGIKIPSGENRFEVSAGKVKNLSVYALGVTLRSDADTNGIAIVSQNNVPYMFGLGINIEIFGYAAEGASSADLMIKASSKITPDSQGNFVSKYSSSGIPAGVFTMDIGGITKTITLSSSPSPTPTLSSNNGGGGGGGAGISTENPDNIEVREKYDLTIYKDKVTSYRFKNESSPILYVSITGNVTANDVNAVVETLKKTSSLAIIPAPGEVYKNINIWVGTGGFAVPKNIKEGLISFRVRNNWIEENNLTRNNVNMLMWNGGEWLMIETVNTLTDEKYTYYESKTNSFSVFAISGFKNEPDSKEEPMITSTPEPAITLGQVLPSPGQTMNKTPGFEILLAIIALIVIRRRL